MEQEIVHAVRSVIGDETANLHDPYLPETTKKYVLETIESGHLSAGIKVKRFEEMLCEITGAKYAVATCNGTCALYATLMCLGLTYGTIKIPALTFVATANAVAQTGMKPYFVEAENAHLPVDLLGNVSSARGIVRDSAQALGAKITGTRIYSFNQNKIVTTSLGGAVVTDDEGLAQEIFHRITTARIPHAYRIDHDNSGWNYRMADVSAAIGIAQLEIFPRIMNAKKALAQRYKEIFDRLGIKMMPTENNWLNTIIVEPGKQISILEALHKAGYQARMLPTPLHFLKPYKNCPRDNLDRSIELWNRAICLPSSPKLGMRFL